MSAVVLKKPKQEDEGEENRGGGGEEENSREEQEEALVALIEHRTKEVQQLWNRVSYYKSQVASVFRSYSKY